MKVWKGGEERPAQERDPWNLQSRNVGIGDMYRRSGVVRSSSNCLSFLYSFLQNARLVFCRLSLQRAIGNKVDWSLSVGFGVRSCSKS